MLHYRHFYPCRVQDFVVRISGLDPETLNPRHWMDPLAGEWGCLSSCPALWTRIPVAMFRVQSEGGYLAGQNFKPLTLPEP